MTLTFCYGKYFAFNEASLKVFECFFFGKILMVGKTEKSRFHHLFIIMMKSLRNSDGTAPKRVPPIRSDRGLEDDKNIFFKSWVSNIGKVAQIACADCMNALFCRAKLLLARHFFSDFFSELFLKGSPCIFSCFATEWMLKILKGSPLSVFRHCETLARQGLALAGPGASLGPFFSM